MCFRGLVRGHCRTDWPTAASCDASTTSRWFHEAKVDRVATSRFRAPWRTPASSGASVEGRRADAPSPAFFQRGTDAARLDASLGGSWRLPHPSLPVLRRHNFVWFGRARAGRRRGSHLEWWAPVGCSRLPSHRAIFTMIDNYRRLLQGTYRRRQHQAEEIDEDRRPRGVATG